MKKAAAQARGSPLLLRRAARALSLEGGASGTIPASTELPSSLLIPGEGGHASLASLEPLCRRVLEVLAVLRRPARREEIAAALGLERGQVLRTLRRLESTELVAVLPGRKRFQLSRPGTAEVLLRRLPRKAATRTHRLVASFLEREEPADLLGREHLARHLLRGDRRAAGRELALEAAEELRYEGFFERAVKLLEDVVSGETDQGRRFTLLEKISELLEEAGDHREGVALLLPLYRSQRSRLSPAQTIRLLRRLGVHYHRSGQGEEAAAHLRGGGAPGGPASRPRGPGVHRLGAGRALQRPRQLSQGRGGVPPGARPLGCTPRR